jgi:hypothetical protein
MILGVKVSGLCDLKVSRNRILMVLRFQGFEVSRFYGVKILRFLENNVPVPGIENVKFPRIKFKMFQDFSV